MQNEYYEQKELWENDFNNLPVERGRLSETIELIPVDVQTILDVGCGNGFFLNSLPSQYQAVGIDMSREALRYVKTKKILGSSDKLPFSDKSFDLVTCLEVLEHLPYDTFINTIKEVERIAKKYIIISVPNKQDLDLTLVVCPSCRCRFNSNYHVRSFSSTSLQTLFMQFKPLQIKEIGPVTYVHTYPPSIFAAYITLIDTVLPQNAICPQCGYRGLKESQAIKKMSTGAWSRRIKKTFSMPFHLTAKSIAKLIWKSKGKHKWIISLHSKKLE